MRSNTLYCIILIRNKDHVHNTHTGTKVEQYIVVRFVVLFGYMVVMTNPKLGGYAIDCRCIPPGMSYAEVIAELRKEWGVTKNSVEFFPSWQREGNK